MTTTSVRSPSLVALDHDTIINNIVKANGNESVDGIDEFLRREEIRLSFIKDEKPTETTDIYTLIQRLESNDDVTQQTRQLVQTYFASVEEMRGLETQSSKALKDVEQAQIQLDNMIKKLEDEKSSL